YGEYTRIHGVGFFGLTDDQYVNSFRSGIWYKPIQLIDKLKFGRNPLRNRVSGIHHKALYLLKLFVAFTATAHIVQVIGGPVCPVIPYRRMQQQQAVSLLNELGDRRLPG